MSDHDRELLTFAEVAERLGVHVNTIRRNVKADTAKTRIAPLKSPPNASISREVRVA